MTMMTDLYDVIKDDISLPEAFPLARKYVWLAIVHPGHHHDDCNSHDHLNCDHHDQDTIVMI